MRHAVLAAFVAVCLPFTIASAPAHAQVSGACFLSDQTDHSGVRVLFSAGSPSAVTDSAFTIADGSFSVALVAGAYEVEYRKDGYLPHAVPDPIFVGVAPVLLPDVTLEPGTVIEISGEIGTAHWTTGTVARVVGNVTVGQFDTLTIDPGVRVVFSGAGYYGFSVFGTALFLGAEGDSIVFESELPGAGPNTYNSISMNGCAGGLAEYCVFRHARSVQAGGACQNPQRLFTFSRCRVERTNYGFALNGGPVKVDDCVMRHNSESGVYMAGCDSNTVLRRCRIVDNTGSSQILVQSSTGWPRILDCVIDGEAYAQPSVYGIDARGSSVIVRRCTVSGARSAGITLNLGSNMTAVEECLITGNAEGIRMGFVLGTIRNNTIVANTEIGLAVNGPGTGGGPLVFNNIVANNGTGLVVNNEVERLEYNDVWGNVTAVTGTALPLGYGAMITANANGDPADIYYNIAEDPLFADAGSGDHHLLPGSPCHDAGDPAHLDPDGTTSDLGCYWLDELTGVPQPGASPGSRLSCVPNPFNPRTELYFGLDRGGPVEVSIHDAAGRRVRRLFRGALPAGPARLAWDGCDDAGRSLPSGVYFGRLTVGAGESGSPRTWAGKMMLVR